MLTILSTIVVLGVLIFVHELGHFLTAKSVDIEVPRFSIGFGPRILGFRRGETEYVLSLLPLGGYVKMAGTEDMEVIEGAASGSALPSGARAVEGAVEHAVTINDTGTDVPATVRTPGPRDFDAKSLPARALVISAGVIMNIIFAFILYSFIGAVWGVPVDAGTVLGGATEERLPAGAMSLSAIRPGMRVTAINDTKISSHHELEIALETARAGDAQMHFDNGEVINFKIPTVDTLRFNLVTALEPMTASPPVIEQIVKGDPADVAGMKPGDRVVQIGGHAVSNWSDLVGAIEHSAGKPLPVTLQRDGQQVALTVTPRGQSREGVTFGRVGIGGAGVDIEKKERAGIIASIRNGAVRTVQTAKETAGLVTGMLSGRQSPRNIGGPIMITRISGQVARLGLEAFLSFMAMLSVNLAVLNMLPIPVLDGGHLVFLLIEGIRGGKPLSMQSRIRWTQVGFAMIVCIMVWAIGNDLWRWIAG